MSQFVKGIGLSLVILGAAVCASAAPIVSLSTADQIDSSKAVATIVNFNSGCGYATCSGDYQIVSGSPFGLYVHSLGTNSSFLTVPKPSATIHTAQLGLNIPANNFGVFWASIDDYNSIGFYRNDVQAANFYATEIVGRFDNGNQFAYASNRSISSDFSNDMYNTVRLNNNGFAFQGDNRAYAKSTFVAEPINLVLMGLGVFGLLAARRAQRKN